MTPHNNDVNYDNQEFIVHINVFEFAIEGTRITEDTKAALKLILVDGESTTNVVKKLGISLNTVESAKATVYKRLQELVDEGEFQVRPSVFIHKDYAPIIDTVQESSVKRGRELKSKKK